MRKRTKSILPIVLTATATITAAVMLLVFLIYQTSFSRREREWFDEKLDAAILQLEAGLMLPVWNLDREAARRILENTLRDPDFVSVRLESNDGLFKPLTLRETDAPEPAFIRSGVVVHGETPLAGFALGVDDSRVRERYRGLRLMFGAATLALEAVLAGALWLLLWQTVLRPLRKLEKYVSSVAVRSASEGEGAQKALNETESVAASVKSMVEQLERRYRDLETAQADLRDSLEEKEVLLRELHHRVKNNLGIIFSLLHFQKERFGDPEVDEMIVGLQNRVQAMAFLHQHLYRSDNLSAVDFSSYLRDLAEGIADSYDRPGGGRIGLDLNLPPSTLDIEIALPCGLLVNELLANAYRHAFPDGRTGTISLQSGEDGDTFEVVVEDDGIGIQKATGTGLGSAIVESLASQIRGEISRESRDGSGTRVVVRFPRNRRLDGTLAHTHSRG